MLQQYFKWEEFVHVFPRLLSCVPTTLILTIVSFAAGTILAIIIAVARIYKIPVLNQIAIVYVSFIRGTPILVQLFICKYFLPALIWSISGVNVGRYWPTITFVIMAYALNCAAFLSEIFRSAVLGVDNGQHEAAYAIGMTGAQSFIFIILPQLFRIALPGIGNSLAGLLKDTSLAYSAAGVIDVMGMVSANSGLTWRFLEGYVGAAIIFFALCVIIQQSFKVLEKKLDYGRVLNA